MKSTLGAILLIGVVLGAPALIALAAVAAGDGGSAAFTAYHVTAHPGSEYHGPENFWSE